METLQPILDLLAAKHGWITAVLGWMSALRIGIKPFSAALQNGFTRLFAFVHETAEADDDAFVAAMLKARWYRVIAFLFDLLASVKLPTKLPPPAPDSRTGPEQVQL
jgi:hypothetical protein